MSKLSIFRTIPFLAIILLSFQSSENLESGMSINQPSLDQGIIIYLNERISDRSVSFAAMAFSLPELDSLMGTPTFAKHFEEQLKVKSDIQDFYPPDSSKMLIHEKGKEFFFRELKKYVEANKTVAPELKSIADSILVKDEIQVPLKPFFQLLNRMYKADGAMPWEISFSLYQGLIISEGNVLKKPSKDFMTDRMFKEWMANIDRYEFVALNETAPKELIERQRAYLLPRLNKRFKNRWEKIAYEAILNAEIQEID